MIRQIFQRLIESYVKGSLVPMLSISHFKTSDSFSNTFFDSINIAMIKRAISCFLM